MTDRRDILKGVGVGVGAMLAQAGGLSAAEAEASELFRAPACLCETGGRIPGEIPNVFLQTHDGKLVRFRDDLVDGSVVMVNCMSIAREKAYPVAANLARVQQLIKARVSGDVRMLSLSVDPGNDTPEALNGFARQVGAQPGWTFLTGSPISVEIVRHTLFDMGASQASAEAHRDCALGLIRYGNAALGLWGAVPTRLDPVQIVDRLTWVQPRERRAGPPRRRGPNPRTYIS